MWLSVTALALAAEAADSEMASTLLVCNARADVECTRKSYTAGVAGERKKRRQGTKSQKCKELAPHHRVAVIPPRHPPRHPREQKDFGTRRRRPV